MKDERLYGKFCLDFPDHPKIAILSDAAFRALIEMTLWSRRHLTDGWLASRLASARWSLEVCQELASNDPVNPSLIAVEDPSTGALTGWFIHDYAAHQDTRAEVEARRERAKAAGQKGGLAKAKRHAKQIASDSLSKNVAETETETENRTTHSVRSSDSGDVKNEPHPGEARTAPSAARGHRLPDGWMPDRSAIDAIRAEFPALDLEQAHKRFVDYWQDQPGAKGRKVSWNGTWRNWMRREGQDRGGRPARPASPGTASHLASYEDAYRRLQNEPDDPIDAEVLSVEGPTDAQ